MYAVIEDSGSQIKVSQGDTIRIAMREMQPDQATVTFDRVLFVGDEAVEGSARIGAPYLAGAKVTADVLSQKKTDKVPVVKFKRRKRILKKAGHRQDYLSVKITGIEG
ncbi:MAG: 50S ribosomal protein L21 [Phycisphaeraceae bacterium]